MWPLLWSLTKAHVALVATPRKYPGMFCCVSKSKSVTKPTPFTFPASPYPIPKTVVSPASLDTSATTGPIKLVVLGLGGKYKALWPLDVRHRYSNGSVSGLPEKPICRRVGDKGKL